MLNMVTAPYLTHLVIIALFVGIYDAYIERIGDYMPKYKVGDKFKGPLYLGAKDVTMELATYVSSFGWSGHLWAATYGIPNAYVYVTEEYIDSNMIKLETLQADQAAMKGIGVELQIPRCNAWPIKVHRESHDGHRVIDNMANGKAFRYCRDCKVEVR